MLQTIVLPFWNQTWELRWVRGGSEHSRWSACLSDYVSMHIFLEEVRTLVTTVTIEHSKVATARPSSFMIRFSYVHYDWHSVLVVVLHQTVEGVDRVALYSAVGTVDKLYCIHSWHWQTFRIIHKIIPNDQLFKLHPTYSKKSIWPHTHIYS